MLLRVRASCPLLLLLLLVEAEMASFDQRKASETSTITIGDDGSWAIRCAGGELMARLLAQQHGFELLGEIMPGIFHLRRRGRHLTRRSALIREDRLLGDLRVLWAERQIPKRRVRRSVYNDPLWPKMWYINDLNEADRKPSMNIMSVWSQGVTGQGIVATVLDDGIDSRHPDLVKNYDPDASYDVNERDFDPSFRDTTNNQNRHGTRCAGLIAASSNNSMCITGVAFGARIGAIRMLDGQVTDAVEATALSYRPQHVDVYSASWGPPDDGRTVEGPGYLVQKALRDGAELGRQGRGSIFIWASGNGGNVGDNCNVDGYANSIYTLTVGSVSEFGMSPWYSETCPCTLAVTYSSGDSKERSVATTDLHSRCTDSHTGTSASAPMAAGIVALVLSVNLRLGWRDIQHLTVRSANPSPFLKSVDWRLNGAGRNASHSFGFGLLDAARMVSLARSWTPVEPQQHCRVDATDSGRDLAIVEENAKASVSVMADCRHVRYLEHVQAVVSLTASRRGELQIWLQSPAGTVSQLLTKRVNDQQANTGFNEWPFMTVHNWGEFGNGRWTLILRCDSCTAKLHTWHLVLYGTRLPPISDDLNQSQSAAAAAAAATSAAAAATISASGSARFQRHPMADVLEATVNGATASNSFFRFCVISFAATIAAIVL